MREPKPTGRWKLTLVTINGQAKFLMLPVYTDGRTRVPARFGGWNRLLSLFNIPAGKCIQLWR